MPTIGSGNFRRQKLEDQELTKIITALEDSEGTESKGWIEKSFLRFNGVLYHYGSEFDEDEPQLAVPN